MLPYITNMLTWWQWGLMAAVPLGVILLYFLKLKRQPLEVPSTFLWHKSIEDLHVNSIWQKLRQSLLLFLQLLLLLLAIFALLRPSWSGTKTIDDRSIYIIDNSASMSARDAKAPGGRIATRLEEAKRQVLELIAQMDDSDVAMVISVSRGAKIEQPFTGDKRALQRAVSRIAPTQKSTEFLEALNLAAGIANPARSGTEAGDYRVAEAKPATLYMFTDGNFMRAKFAVGELQPKYIKLGDDDVANVSIAAFSSQPNEEDEQEMQVFGSLENHGRIDATVTAELYLDGAFKDAKHVHIAPGDFNGVVFDLPTVETGMLKLRIRPKQPAATTLAAGVSAAATSLTVNNGDEFPVEEFLVLVDGELMRVTKRVANTLTVARGEFNTAAVPHNGGAAVEEFVGEEDALDIDDVAWTAVNTPRRANVLLVTPGNEPLEVSLKTELAMKIAGHLVKSPEFLKTDDYRQQALAGVYDLIIYDRCLPEPKKPAADEKAEDMPTAMPQANTWFIGAVPRLPNWGFQPDKPWPAANVLGPNIIDVNGDHPITRFVEMGAVKTYQAVPVTPDPDPADKSARKWPVGGVPLMTAVASRQDVEVQCSVFSIAPREGFQDAVLGLAIIDKEDEPNTDWPIHESFPLTVLNLLRYLGESRAATSAGVVRPGDAVDMKIDTPEETLTVVTPGGGRQETKRSPENIFRFSQTGRMGAYQIQDPQDSVVHRFAVNLFDSRESNLKPQPEVDLDWEKVQAETSFQTARKEYWRPLLLLALLVLAVEWYIYHRRVYL